MPDYESVLVDYFEKVDSGLPVDPDEFIRAHPEHEARLRRFFVNAGELNQLIGESGDASKLAADRPLASGKTLGDFRILREIGRGGMGVVYEAEQIGMGRPVALKVLHAAAALDPEKRKRFENEVRAVATLSHDHIVPVYAVGEHEGTNYFAMKLIHGQTLAKAMHARGGSFAFSTVPLRSEETRGAELDTNGSAASHGRRKSAERHFFEDAAKLIATIADAIGYAHQHGIIHRDIKPSNLLLDGDGKVWVTDFGLARLEHEASLTTTGDVLGTVQYMSPEQAAGKGHVDGRTDVYSLGVVLYVLLAGELPFRGNHRMMLHRVIHDDPAAPRSLNHAIPRDLETICLKCLRKEPGQRYPTAEELAADVRRYLAGEPIHAQPIGPARRAIKWARRRPKAAMLTAAIFAVVGVAYGLTLRHAHVVSGYNRDLVKAGEEKDQAISTAQSKTHQLEQEAYVRDLKLAHAAWLEGDLRQYENLLLRHHNPHSASESPGIEWRFLWQLGHFQSERILDDGDPLYSVRLSPKGDVFAVAGADGRVRIYSTNSHQVESEFDAEQGEVNSAEFDPTGQRVATAGDDGSVCVWDWKTGRRMLRIAAHRDLAFCGVFDHTGERLITCGREPDIHIWNAKTGDHVATLSGHSGSVEQISLSPDGSKLASASSDQSVRLWNLQDLSQAANFPTEDTATCVTFSHYGNDVCAADKKGNIYRWNVTNGKPLPYKSTAIDSVHSIVASSNRYEFAVGDGTGTIHVFGESRLRERARHQSGRVYGLTYGANGFDLISAGSNGALNRWKRRDRSHVPYLKGVYLARLQALSATLVCGANEHGGFFLFDPDSEKEIESLDDKQEWKGAVASADGQLVAAIATSGRVELWDVERRTVKKSWSYSQRPNRYIVPVALSSHGDRIAISSADDEVVLMDTETGRIVQTLSAPDCDFVRFSRDDAFLLMEYQNDFTLLDLQTGRRIGPFAGHDGPILDCVFSPTGNMIASASGDRTIRLWDSRSAKEVAVLEGHKDGVHRVWFSRDGNTLISHDTKTVAFWDIRTRQCFFQHVPQSEINTPTDRIIDFAVSPDEQWMAVSGRLIGCKLIHFGVGAPTNDSNASALGSAPVFSSETGSLAEAYVTDGDSDGDQFGYSVSGAGDVNGDGFDDIIVGAPLDDNNGTDSGSARVLSGLDGSVLFSLDGDCAGAHFGFSVSGAGDVNGDGCDDVVIGAPLYDDNDGADSGSARVLSGQDGSVLFALDGDSAGDNFGFSVSGAGDVNGDGFDDFLVGARFDDNNGTDSGSARVFSGRDGSVLYTFDGDAVDDRLGWSVSDAGDVNGDGFDDVIVGLHRGDGVNGKNSGVARVFSGRDGSVLFTFDGDSAGDQFGFSVSGAGDVNGDGFDDFLVGAPTNDATGDNSGSARVFSGHTGGILFTCHGESRGGQFGWSVSGAGDVNGDGFDDVVVGANRSRGTSGDQSGSAFVYSGQTGRAIATFHGSAAGHRFGQSVSGAGDVNGDGRGDVIVGAVFEDNNGVASGSAHVYASVDNASVDSEAP